jgi:hypothetical protein
MRAMVILLVSLVMGACASVREYDPSKPIQYEEDAWTPQFSQEGVPVHKASLARGLSKELQWYPKTFAAQVMLIGGVLLMASGLEEGDGLMVLGGVAAGAGACGLSAWADSDLIEGSRFHNREIEKSEGRVESRSYSMRLLSAEW